LSTLNESLVNWIFSLY